MHVIMWYHCSIIIIHGHNKWLSKAIVAELEIYLVADTLSPVHTFPDTRWCITCQQKYTWYEQNIGEIKLTVHMHYRNVIMSAMASQIAGGSIVCSTVLSGTDQSRYQSSTSLALVTSGFHSQRASNVENVPISWSHNVYLWNQCYTLKSWKSRLSHYCVKCKCITLLHNRKLAKPASNLRRVQLML